MQQLRENRVQLRLGQKLYHHYREYVQFLNDFIICRPYTSMFILLPNIVMIMELSVHFSHTTTGDSSTQISTFFNNVSYLGISSAIIQLINISSILRYTIMTVILLLLLSPLITIAQILILTVFSTNHKKEIGHYRKLYQSSLIHKFIRVFIATFEYVAMPVFTSVGMKLSMSEVEDGMANVTVGTLVLILVPIVYVLGEYHLLEIIDDNDSKPEQQQSLILSRINFPNNILDSILVYLYLILINKLTQSYPFIIAIIIYLVRIFIAAYFKYYQPGVLKEQLFILISSLVTILGLFIAYLCKEIYIVMLCVVVLLVLINRVKDKVSMNGHKQYDLLQNQEKTVEELKRDLWRNGTFTYVFRELIFLSRKSNSHRKQLLIEILKVKCYQLESKSRGGAKMTNTEDLLKFQNLFVNFLGNMLLIGDNSISILRLLQNKDPKREIFAHQVKLLVNRINQNKQIVARMREINDISSQGLVLMKIMFNQFYNDLEFVKDMEQKSRMHITSLAQKQVKTRLFNKKTTAIFINILDQPGKITRVSKNLPAVLGHSPSDLLGKSINEIIPFTIQPFHDQNLIKFVQKYSKKTMRSDPRIQFFAYNKDFHLQQCVIRYNFVMSFFSSFELSGVMRKIQEENKNVILMNEDGVLEGWTEQLASVFNFDEFQTGECLKFNVLSLFPSLIKYNEAGGCNIKTVFFRSGKVKQKALQITQYRNLKGRQLQQKQMYTFKHLLQTDELIQAYLADVQYQLISFCHDKAKMKKIVIKNFERIENFNQIQDNILKTLNGEKLDDNDEDDLDQKELDKDVSMSEYSMAGDQNQKAKIIDSNFTLDFTKPHAFKKQEIRLQSQVSKSQLSIELTDVNHMQEDHLINDEINANAAQQQGNDSLIEASFSPKLQTQTNFIPFLIFIALCFIGIITWDQVVLSNTETLMKKQCTNVINRNRALMIYAKSSFNPNASYIREFDNGKLMEVSTFLGNQNFNYKTFLGDTIIENRFYMFNIQIPSTLDRILMTPNDTKRAQYQKEIEYNFYDVMQAWIERFTESDQEWASTISSVRSNFTIRLIIISIGSIAFSLFLIYIYMQYRKQKKMTEAFFKFQKVDLDEKMAAIRKVIKNLQIKAMQWHLDKEFYDFIKKKDITNLQFEMQTNPCETKIKFETSQQAEQKLAKKKLYSVVLFIAVFLLTQILFIILYSVLNFSQIDNFETIPQQLNKACKLIVLPNLMLANMFYTVPENMLTGYKSIQTQVLEKPLQSVPELFNLLEDAPCMDCQFMYPLLTTNFRSFYSTFEQVINQKTLNNDKNITQLFYAVDVVVQRVTQSLTLQTLMFLPATVFLYIFSLTVFFLSIYFNVRKMIEENEKLEVFLKYFDEEILVKNKHMNGLLNKNT